MLKRVIAGVALGLTATVQAAEPPNILWILAEDITTDLACYGVSGAHTPNLDRLASEGVRFTRAYVTAPVCSPSRSAMMTGMHQNAIGAHQHRTKDKVALPAPVRPFPELLHEAGYHVARRPGKKLDLNFAHDPSTLFPGDGAACTEPFFVQRTIANTHRPWADRPEFDVDPATIEIPPYYPDTRLVRRDFANGFEEIAVMDARIGRILDELEEQGLAERTLVIFVGDNGRCQPRGKQFLYEPGVHVPLIMRWPGRLEPGSVRTDLVSAIDITASVLGAAGLEVPKWMHGRDLLDDGHEPRDHVVFARDKMDDTHDAMRGIRDDHFKYILNLMPERAWCQFNEYKERRYPILALLNASAMAGRLDAVQATFMAPQKPVEELYDLEEDPHETVNLAGDLAEDPVHAAVLADMRARLADWQALVGDSGVSDEFRAGGWPADYPTRTSGEWRARVREWETRLFPPRRYACAHTSAAIVVDGRIDDEAWASARWTSDFGDIRGPAGPPPRFRTRAKMTWDDTYLYVAAELDEPHVWGTLTKHDQVIYHDNDFEVFIDPEGDETSYYEIEVNALNTVFDLMLSKPYSRGGGPDTRWNAEGLLTAVHIDGTVNDPSDTDRSWSVEVAIPWSVFTEHSTVPSPPRPGDTWRINFSRVQWRHTIKDGKYVKVPKRESPEDNWTWSPQYAINMHLPEWWGFVEFSE